jgi:TP901 family phage tail tape measure protein
VAEKSVIRELVTLFSFDADEQQLKAIDKAVNSVKNRLKEGAKAAGVFLAAVGAITRQVTQQGAELIATSRKLRISTDALQEWRFAGESAGIALGSINGALSTFSTNIGQAARGQGPAIAALGRLGISVRDASGQIRDLDTLLAEAVEGLDDFQKGQEQGELATALFGGAGQDMVLMLENGVEGLRQLRKEAHATGGVMSKDLALQAKENAQAWLEVRMAIRGVVNALGRDLLPIVAETLRGVASWVSENRELVATFGKIGLAILALRVPLALLGAKLTLIFGLAAAVFLISEDISQGLSGNAKSFTGQLLRSIPALIDWVRDEAIAMADDFWGYTESRAEKLVQWIKETFPSIYDLLMEGYNALPASVREYLDGAQEGPTLGMADAQAPGEARTEFMRKAAESIARTRALHAARNQSVNVTVNAAPGQSATEIASEVTSKLSGQRVMIQDSMLGGLAP